MYIIDNRRLKDEVFAMETDRLRLAVLKKGAAQKVADYYVKNRGFHKKWAQTQPDSYFTAKTQKEYLKSDVSLFWDDRLVPFFIFLKDEPDKVIGRISIFNIVRGGMQCGTVGYHMDEEYCGRGIMTEALRAVAKFGFEELKLHRIEAYIMPFNERSLKLAERVGFEDEGYRKSYMHINGHWQDHRAFVLFEENLKEK